MRSFASLELSPPLAQAIEVMGFQEMTPIQEQSLPLLLKGRDVIAQAQTGSGKTVAFGSALLSQVRSELAEVQALVLCPTRELAEQVTGELRRLARFIPNVRIVTLSGGVPARTQKPALERPPPVLVGTPGRIRDHIARGNIKLDTVRVLVLDEADRMLDMGFLPEIREVVAKTPKQRQTLLFSATYTEEIREVSRSFQRSPAEVTVEQNAGGGEVEQVFYEVEPPHKLEALMALLHEREGESALVFCHTRSDAREVAEQLSRRGFSALPLHGELDQRQRDEALLCFAHESCAVLVATDVAARGLDIEALPLVVSWELPTDADVHTHRIGRTGRAGRRGRALALCSERERTRLAALEERLGQPVRWGALPPKLGPTTPAPAPMVTVLIEGGRKDKLRPGDLLGAFAAEFGLPGEAIGKITVGPSRAYVSVQRAQAKGVLLALRERAGKLKIKGKAFRASALRP